MCHIIQIHISMNIVNIALIGENLVGKTSIIRSYIDENETQKCASIPQQFLKKNIIIDGQLIELRLWDSQAKKLKI